MPKNNILFTKQWRSQLCAAQTNDFFQSVMQSNSCSAHFFATLDIYNQIIDFRAKFPNDY